MFVLAFTLFCSLLISEQEKEKEEKRQELLHYDLVVTATRLETPQKEIATSFSLITRNELERSKKNSVFEALQEIPGLSLIQNGSPGGSASAFIRGANSEHTLVMIDGVELNDPISPSRSCDLAHFMLENVERIEILRGPQSTLYGSDAMGGIIHILTRMGEGRPRLRLQTQVGSFGTLSSMAEFSGGTGRFSYSLGTSYFKTEGISAANSCYEGNEEKDGYKNFSLGTKFSLQIRENLELSFFLKAIDSNSDIDNFGGAFGDDPNSTQKLKTFVFKGESRTLWLENRWEQKLSVSLFNSSRKHDNPEDETHPYDSEHGHFHSRRLALDWQHNFFLNASHTLTLGLDLQQEMGKSEYFSESFWGTYSNLFPEKKAHQVGVYIQEQLRISGCFFATAGLRVDNHSQTGNSLTYRLAPAFFLKKTETKLKATFGTGFKSPSLYQLYAPQTFWGPIGNENLMPEKSSSWDAGVEQSFFQGHLTLAVTYFGARYENLIEFDYTQGFINIAKASSRGAEFSLSLIPLEKLRFLASYTRLKAKNENTGELLLRRPKEKFLASVSLDFLKKGNFILSLIFNGERDDMEYREWTSVRVKMPRYTLLNAAISYELAPSTQIFCRFDNILDSEYEMIKGYGAAGFSIYGGLKLSL